MGLEPIFRQAQKHNAESLKYLAADFEVFWMLLVFTLGLKKDEETNNQRGRNRIPFPFPSPLFGDFAQATIVSQCPTNSHPSASHLSN